MGEKDAVSLIIIDESCCPASLTDHLKFLSALRFVPVIRISGLKETLAPVVKINSISAMGFSKELRRNEELGMLANNLLARAKKVKIPWTYYELSPPREYGSTEDADKKVDDVVDVDSSTVDPGKRSDLVQYEGVVVKKITPNSEKVKKKKQKKNKQRS